VENRMIRDIARAIARDIARDIAIVENRIKNV